MFTGTIDAERVQIVFCDVMHTLLQRGDRHKEAKQLADLIGLPADQVHEGIRRVEVSAPDDVKLDPWLGMVCGAIGYFPRQEGLRPFFNAWVDIVVANTPLYPRAKETIQTIRSYDYQFSLASTVSHLGKAVLRKHHLRGTNIDGAYLSVDFGTNKEHDEFFERLIHYKSFSPAQALFVDDNLSYVRRAQRLGFQVATVLHADGDTGQKIAKGEISRQDLTSAGIAAIDAIDELPQLLLGLPPIEEPPAAK